MLIACAPRFVASTIAAAMPTWSVVGGPVSSEGSCQSAGVARGT